jgi:hypothetical protein
MVALLPSRSRSAVMSVKRQCTADMAQASSRPSGKAPGQTRRHATLAQAGGAPSRSATSAPDDDLGGAAAVQHLDGGAVPPA